MSLSFTSWSQDVWNRVQEGKKTLPVLAVACNQELVEACLNLRFPIKDYPMEYAAAFTLPLPSLEEVQERSRYVEEAGGFDNEPMPEGSEQKMDYKTSIVLEAMMHLTVEHYMNACAEEWPYKDEPLEGIVLLWAGEDIDEITISNFISCATCEEDT